MRLSRSVRWLLKALAATLGSMGDGREDAMLK